MLLVEGAVGLPDREDQVEQFPHAVPDRHVPPFALGLEPLIQGAHGWVVLHGRARCIPQIAADQVVALVRHAQRARRQRPTLLVHPGTLFLREDAEVADEVLGGREAFDVDDLGDEHGCGGVANTGNGANLVMATRWQLQESVLEQLPQFFLVSQAVTELGR
jgi:hypothetical protein